MQKKSEQSATEVIAEFISEQYLNKNVFYYLVAVVVHANVTGEGLAQENISERKDVDCGNN